MARMTYPSRMKLSFSSGSRDSPVVDPPLFAFFAPWRKNCFHTVRHGVFSHGGTKSQSTPLDSDATSFRVLCGLA
jgi:hypothetical protein